MHHIVHLDEEAIDGFTWRQIRAFVADSVVDAVCEACGLEHSVEPDARDYDCNGGCGQLGSVTSPLVKLGLI